MTKPSIVFVPGSFSYPEFYDNVVDPVREKGYEIKVVRLLSAGKKEGPPPTMYDDAAAIQKEVEKFADEGKDVVLIGHSYGGIPTSQSIQGLSKEERAKNGKKGGIVRVAYKTCLVPALGFNAAGVLESLPEEAKISLPIDEQGWMYHADYAVSARICFSHLPLAEGEAWMRKFPEHSAVSFTNELTYEGYKDVPVSYLLCEEDMCITPETQRAGIEMIEKVSGRKVDVTSIKADHIPSASQPNTVIDWFIDLAKKSEASV